MRVERSTLDQVQAAMEQQRHKKEATEAAAPCAQPRPCHAARGAAHLQAEAESPNRGRAAFQERVALREEEEAALREARRERKQEKKARQGAEKAPGVDWPDCPALSMEFPLAVAQRNKEETKPGGGAGDGEGMDPEMMALMGFSGFAAKGK